MDKKEAKQIMNEVREIVREWDVLGVADIAPEDEYDCLVGPLTSLVAKGASRDELRAFMEKDMNGHFGLTDQEYNKDSLENALNKLLILQNKL